MSSTMGTNATLELGQVEEAKDKLITFLDETMNFLSSLVEKREILYPQELRSKIANAWNEFYDDFDLGEAKRLISDAEVESLQDHGLYGSQLDLKLSVIDFWRQKFIVWDYWDNTKKDILKWLIDSIDTLLKSLLQATGISGAIEEIKECMSNSLDMVDMSQD